MTHAKMATMVQSQIAKVCLIFTFVELEAKGRLNGLFKIIILYLLGRTKVLIASGSSNGGAFSEIIDLTDASFRCNVSQFPTTLILATGGVVGNTPIICGGGTKSCYSLKEDGTWKDEADLNEARGNAARGNAIMNNKLVIAGGINGNGNRLKTIEVVAPNTKSETLPIVLPVGISGSPCIVPWDATTFMIIGGHNENGYSNQTYFVNMATNTSSPGPSLQYARTSIGCHILKVQGSTFIIAAGGYNGGGKRTTEYLAKVDLDSGWRKSKNLQHHIRWHEIR